MDTKMTLIRMIDTLSIPRQRERRDMDGHFPPSRPLLPPNLFSLPSPNLSHAFYLIFYLFSL